MDKLSFEEVAAKYPDFPRTILRKIDTELRGVIPTERALGKAKAQGAFYSSVPQNGEEPNHNVFRELGLKTDKPLLGGVFFRDGTSVLSFKPVPQQTSGGELNPVLTCMNGLNSAKSRLKNKSLGSAGPFSVNSDPERTEESLAKPYLFDLADDRFWFLDEGKPVEEVYLSPLPEYFRKKTSRGTPMIKVVSSKVPNRVSVNIFAHCQFAREKLPCKYCSYSANNSFFHLDQENRTPENLEDIYETVNEILEEKGKWTNINLIGGSDPRPGGLTGQGEPYENEVNEYIKVLRTLQRCFAVEKNPAVNRNGSLPVNAIASAFSRGQLLRLKEAGLGTYISNIEVWDKRLFELICPGKAKYFGRQYWMDSILSAVEIFGRGNVSTQLVAGAELAEPYGFKNIEEALASDLEGVEFFARNGVYATFCILWVHPGSVFYREKQKLPSLEYYVRLAKGINEIRKKYNFNASYSGYRGDGFHLDMDLARLDFNN